MTTLRTFVGLPMPESYRDILSDVRRELSPGLASRLTWTRPEQFHLTLKFLGPTDESLLPELVPAMEQSLADAHSFAFQAAGGGFFPPGGKPRVIWAGLSQGAEPARGLAKTVETALAPLGFAPENQPFAPHLTLARVKEARRDAWEEILARLQRVQWPQLEMQEVVFWKSEPGAGKHVHTALKRFDLLR